MNRKYSLGILLALFGVSLIYTSLAVTFLDSVGFWGFPKDFLQALLLDRGFELAGSRLQGIQFLHCLLGGIVLTAFGTGVVAVSVENAIYLLFLEPWTYSYKILGRRVKRLLPHFEDLHGNLKKGGIGIAFPAYVSFMLLMSIVVFSSCMVTFPFLLPLVFRVGFLSTEDFILSIMFAGLCSLLAVILIYIFPGIRSSNRGIPIEVNLPYLSSFLTLLSSSNVPPKLIFHSLIKIDTLREVRQEFGNIVRDIEVFGQDLLTSISENAKYTPSAKLREILNGYVATIKTGGDPTEYLRITRDNIMKEKMVKLDLMLESLSAMAEIYIMVLVAMPLLFVVLLATLGMLGSAGSMNPILILYLLLYAGIPVLATILIVVVSTFTVG